ncbi:hypothetical protein [Arenimonas sp.]|uniref:hypothetical protein n=1 Tax=Arenimonas sp. TaxID=1872635 RepID=UPI0039E33C96
MAFWKSAKTPHTTGDTPTDTAKPATPASVRPSRATATNGKAKTLELAEDSGNPAVKSSNKGFDPYNSGVFDSRRTWERVIRK